LNLVSDVAHPSPPARTFEPGATAAWEIDCVPFKDCSQTGSLSKSQHTADIINVAVHSDKIEETVGLPTLDELLDQDHRPARDAPLQSSGNVHVASTFGEGTKDASQQQASQSSSFNRPWQDGHGAQTGAEQVSSCISAALTSLSTSQYDQ
jgi:hypothetical protein